MCWLPVPNELTRTPSRSSGVAPHLESSERVDPSTVLCAVLLQVWSTQSCCSGVAPDLAYLGNFAKSLDYSRVLQSLQVSGLSALQRNHQEVFFSQFSSVWPFPKFEYPVLRMISRPPQRGSVLGYSSSLYVSHIPLGSFLNRPVLFTSAVPA